MKHFFDIVSTEYETVNTVFTVYATDQELVELLKILNVTKGNSDCEFTAVTAE